MSRCRGASDDDEPDIVPSWSDRKRAGKSVIVRRSRGPARRSSSANSWSLISWTSLSSTVSFRFSRMSVRSTSFFISSTRRSTSARESGGASEAGLTRQAYARPAPALRPRVVRVADVVGGAVLHDAAFRDPDRAGADSRTSSRLCETRRNVSPLSRNPAIRSRHLALEALVAHRERLVHEEDVGVHVRRDREREARGHARRVGPDRSVEELLDLGERRDRVHAAEHLLAREPHERPVQDHVLAARELAVEPEAELEERRDAPADDDAVPPWAGRTRAMSRKRLLLPAPFDPMTPTRSPRATVRFTSRRATSVSCSMRPWSFRIAYSFRVTTTSRGIR